MHERETVPRKRQIRFWHVGLVILGLLAIAFGVLRIAARAKVQQRLAAIRAAGYPTTFAELDDWYTIPTYVDNAADYITRALGLLHVPKGEEAEGIPLFHSRTELPARTVPLDEQTQAKLAPLLEANREALELLHAAASVPDCRYPVDLRLGNGAWTAHLTPLRDATRLLILEAALSAARNDSESATGAVVSGYGLARSLLKEPVTISQLVRMSCGNLTSQALERVVNRVELSDAQLVRIEEALLASYDPNAIARGLVGERCFMLSNFRDPRATGVNGPPGVVWQVFNALGLLDRGLIRYLDHTSAAIEVAQGEPHRRQKAIAQVESQRETGSKLTSIFDSLAPAFGRIVILDLHHLARLQVTRTALAVQRYRLAHGELPQRLDDLMPAFLEIVPADPFDGQPLRFQKLAPGFIVYSVGSDGTDDAGQERQPMKSGQPEAPYDITFIIER
ncbi:MAG: hypothetical protein JW993_11410 [Sedimentisphaerales bacterium]|nr:hypothetical protein [Sedimentisphaerales bacterium]